MSMNDVQEESIGREISMVGWHPVRHPNANRSISSLKAFTPDFIWKIYNGRVFKAGERNGFEELKSGSAPQDQCLLFPSLPHFLPSRFRVRLGNSESTIA